MALVLLCAFTRVVAKMGREECMLTCAEVHDHECSSPPFHVFSLFPNTYVSPLSSRWIPGRLVSLRTRKQPGEIASKLPSHELTLVSETAEDWLATAAIWIVGPDLSHPHKDLSLQLFFPLGPTAAPCHQNVSQEGHPNATFTSPKHLFSYYLKNI